ncbi:MAG: hypothetical protein AAFQ89_03590 [Cyanobacteria bacterium J06626_18]
MTESVSTQGSEQDAVQELTEVITELEAYRERLSNDTMTMAKRAKVLRSKALSDLEPELNKIDATLENLRAQLAQLTHQG